MNPSLVLRSGALVCVLATLAACASSAPRAQAAPRMASGAALLQQVRASGQLGNELDVQPLRDPQVEDLRGSAHAAEARGDFAGAQRALSQALQVSGDDPELLQWWAEMALVAHDFEGARQYAMKSWERGPKLGGLCRRNWTTLRFAAESRADATAAAEARRQADACAVAPPTRY
jgi:Flp pilus assembly protein TadD